MRIASVSLLVGLLVFAICLSAQNSNYSMDPTWKVPAASAAQKNPFAGNAKATAEGRELFEAQCSMCHGFDGRGIANAANFHLPLVQKQSDGTIFWKITTGNQTKGMPSFQRLPAKARWELVNYLRTFRSKRSR